MGGRRRRRRRGGDKLEVDTADSPAKAASPHQHQEQPSTKEEEEDEISDAWTQEDRRAMRRSLLSLIHCYYLEAISRLPTADIRTTLVRGLLVGGHCYGPLGPVHNILVNSIWYAAAFSLRTADRIELHMISTDGILRLCHSSLHGLIASLRYYCPALSTDDDALYHLSLADADLRLAIASANQTSSVKPLAAMASMAHGANKVAAEAAQHPNPAAYALFASSLLPSGLDQEVDMLLRGRYLLSSPDLERLSSYMLLRPEQSNVLPPTKLSHPRVLDIISSYKANFKHQEQHVLQVVSMALHKYMLRTGKQFDLHVICGINFLEGGESGHRCHLNFLACPNSTGSAPVLFFCEAAVPTRDDKDIWLCVPVVPSSGIPPRGVGGCFGCEANKKNIAHPPCKQYVRGRYLGEDETGNDRNCMKPLDVDCIFFYADKENVFCKFLGENEILGRVAI